MFDDSSTLLNFFCLTSPFKLENHLTSFNLCPNAFNLQIQQHWTMLTEIWNPLGRA